MHSVFTPAFTPIRRRDLLLLLAGSPLLLAVPERSIAAEAVRTVELKISTDGDLLAFNPAELTCPTGVHVRLFFHNAGRYISANHNWVLIQAGALEAVTAATATAGAYRVWVPSKDRRVLAATPPCSNGQTVMVEFTAPAVGDYPFICSNPGHAASMRGVLHVTAAEAT